MDPNPYSAPKAPVADPELLPVARPRVATRAVQLLWLSLALGLIANLSAEEVRNLTPSGDGFRLALLVTNVVVFVLTAWLIFKVGRGRNWARIVYLALVVVGDVTLVISWQRGTADYAGDPYVGALVVAATFAELVAVCLLFTKPANRWFAAPMRPSGPPN